MVDRPTVKMKVVATAGEDAWLTMVPNFRRLCDLADGTINEPNKYFRSDE